MFREKSFFLADRAVADWRLDTRKVALYDPRMKASLVPILFVAGVALTGCESDMPPSSSADNPIQRGLRGEGQLTQPDKSDDPIIRETTRTGH